MAKILGLDLGTNSIGWALINDSSKKILGAGSRIFEEGVINLGQGERESSKNASRRDNRGTRRQHFRRKLRKRQLLKELAKNGLCPIEYDHIKSFSNEIFKIEAMIKWFQLNPYELRAKAVKEKISLIELGRILYHLNQRRGFQSNSRRDNSEDGAIYKGDKKIDKVGITETVAQMGENATLGQMLSQLYPAEGQPYKANQQRIRNRYTTRQMYIDEFERIWKFQEQFHPALTYKLKTQIGGRKKDGHPEDGVLFFQRPLKSQKHLVGNCPFEPTKTKCPKSKMMAEEFRIFQWINTVECNDSGLTAEERKMVAALLMREEKPKFEKIRKALGKEGAYYQFNYKDDDKILGAYTIRHLSSRKYFGNEWFSKTEKEREEIWHIIYFFEDKNMLKDYAITKWGFDEHAAEEMSNFKLKTGYAGLSSRAIKNILPFLKEGFVYSDAVMLGGVKNALGNKWASLTDNDRKYLIETCIKISREKLPGGYLQKLKLFLQESYDLPKHRLEKLYHHSQQILAEKLYDKLPVGTEADKELIKLRNPVVVTALFELRKVINELIDEFGKPDKIVVELARDLKSNKTKRLDTRRKQKRNEEENDRVKAELEKLGQTINHDNLLKYKLWEECDKTCPYTGRNIKIQQLFSGEVQIEHILPWSKTLNNSYINKTLCFADENRAKGDNSPYEYYYKKQGLEKWEQVKAQALSCFKNKTNYPDAYIKFKQFVKTSYDDDFISRQLNDTRYISKEAKNYLKKICANVIISTGQVTSDLKYKWGLNTILDVETGQKNRSDHRHHAVDALVLASSTTSHLSELSRWNRYRRSYETKDFPAPWLDFRNDAEEAINKILVSYKKNTRVLTTRNVETKKGNKRFKNKSIIARGQLHKESVFGERTSPDSIKAYHIRKPIESRKTRKQIDKIVDQKIRDLIYKRVKELGGFTPKGYVPPETYFTTDNEGGHIPQIYLPNKNGDAVPVMKVRIREKLGSAIQLKNGENKYVNPRNNHHILIYRNNEGKICENVVTLLEAVERKKQKRDLYQLPKDGKEIIAILHINDTYLLGLKKDDIAINELNYSFLAKYLYKVEALSSKYYEFRLSSEATQDNDKPPYYIRIQSFGTGKTGWETYNPIRVLITPGGNIKVLDK